MPTLSVILPNRNHARELGVSLPALLGQSRPADEIIVIDDASTDSSLDVITAHTQAQPHVKVIANEVQKGVAQSVNLGLDAADGDYVLLASADECLNENAVEQLVAAMTACPDAALGVSVYAEWHPERNRLDIHDKDSEHGMWYVDREDPVFVAPERFRALLRQRFVWLGINTAIFRRSALRDVGGFDPALRWHSDWFAIYAVALRHGFCAIPYSLAWFRVNGSSYSAVGMRDKAAQRQVAMAIQCKLRDPAFSDIDDAVMKTPVVMSTFLRPTLMALAARPRWYPRLARLLVWWFGEVARGRRPGAWARIVERMRWRGTGMP